MLIATRRAACGAVLTLLGLCLAAGGAYHLVSTRRIALAQPAESSVERVPLDRLDINFYRIAGIKGSASTIFGATYSFRFRGTEHVLNRVFPNDQSGASMSEAEAARVVADARQQRVALVPGADPRKAFLAFLPADHWLEQYLGGLLGIGLGLGGAIWFGVLTRRLWKSRTECDVVVRL